MIQYLALSASLPQLLQLLVFLHERCADDLISCMPRTMVQLVQLLKDGSLPCLQTPRPGHEPFVQPVRVRARRGVSRHCPADGPQRTRQRCWRPVAEPSSLRMN